MAPGDIFELADNLIQVACLLFAVIKAVPYVLKHRDMMLLQFVLGMLVISLMGDTMWTVSIWIDYYLPQGLAAWDLAFIGIYFFEITICLSLMNQWTAGEKQIAGRYRLKALAAPAVMALSSVIHIAHYGHLIHNLFYAVPAVIASYFACWLMLAGGKGGGVQPSMRPYHVLMLMWLAIQQVMFITSSYGLDVAYYVFDISMSVTYLFIFPAAKKGAVDV